MKKVRVDWDQLESALEDASWTADYCLDTETGEVELINEDSMPREEVV